MRRVLQNAGRPSARSGVRIAGRLYDEPRAAGGVGQAEVSVVVVLDDVDPVGHADGSSPASRRHACRSRCGPRTGAGTTWTSPAHDGEQRQTNSDGDAVHGEAPDRSWAAYQPATGLRRAACRCRRTSTASCSDSPRARSSTTTGGRADRPTRRAGRPRPVQPPRARSPRPPRPPSARSGHAAIEQRRRVAAGRALGLAARDQRVERRQEIAGCTRKTTVALEMAGRAARPRQHEQRVASQSTARR